MRPAVPEGIMADEGFVIRRQMTTVRGIESFWFHVYENGTWVRMFPTRVEAVKYTTLLMSRRGSWR
jgi:hypothetical protein